MMEGLYRLLRDAPQLMAPATHEDDAFPNWFNKSAYGKPALETAMRKFLRSMEQLIDAMIAIGAGAEGKLTRRQRTILDRLGVDPGHPGEAWSWMATARHVNRTAFTRCFFRADYPYERDVYARHFGAAFERLEGWMLDSGYTRIDHPEGGFSVVYVNLAWDPVPPMRAESLYKIRHTGISLVHEPRMAQPYKLGLCIPGNMRQLLEAFGLMDALLQAFVLKHTKACDGCRYCVQTDPSGERPLANVPVQTASGPRRLCPYFPGAGFSWFSAMEDALADQIIAMLTFMDALRPTR